MERIIDIFWQILDIINEMSPYLLLGFLLAGLMHAFIPGTMYSRYLSARNFRSVVYAALFGIPLPLCSCGVIPTAMSLRREGASKGAAVSFLIATPQTGVDSIAATYSLMGLPFAIVRPIAALCTSLFGGQLVNLATPNDLKDFKDLKDPKDLKDKPTTLAAKLRQVLRYGFVEMMEDIGKWLVMGLIAAGLITVLVPDSFFAIFKDNTLYSMLLVLCIAIPMYICATGSIPIAVALMMKGLTPGAALVLLMAGPACNVASMLVVNKVLGKKTLLVYLASIILGSVAFGFAIDQLPAAWFVPTMQSGGACCHKEGMEWFNLCCTILLLLLLVNALIHHYHHPHCHCNSSSSADGNSTKESNSSTCQLVNSSTKENNSSTKESNSSTNKNTPQNMKLEFTIKGMNCNHCRANALKALNELPGVTAADVDLASGRAYIEGTATIDQVKSAIDSLGFTVV